MALSRIVTTRTSSGGAIGAGELELFPRTRSTQLVLPKGLARAAWNRPCSVKVKYTEDYEKVLRVRDLTRTIQIVIAAGSAALALALLTTEKTIRRYSHE